MLADVEIKKILKSGKVTVEPYDETLLGSSCLDVRLGKVLLKPKKGQLIDLRKPELIAEYEKVDLTDEGFILEPGEFVLGQTYEFIGTSGDVGLFIDGRSTLARLGLSIHQTATFILPGTSPHIITLEIYNSSTFRVVLFPQMRIGKLMFFKLGTPNEIEYKSYGRYSGQSETTGARLINGTNGSF